MAGIITPLAVPGLALSILCHALGLPTLGGIASLTGSGDCAQPAHAVTAPILAARCVAFRPAPRMVVRDFQQSTPVRTAGFPPVAGSRIFVVPSLVEADPVPTLTSEEVRAAQRSQSDNEFAETPKPAAAPAPETDADTQTDAQQPAASREGRNPSASLEQQEISLLAMVNRERISRGEQALTLSPLLCDVARTHSEDMCRRHYFEHVAPAPGPQTPMDRFLAAVPQRPDRAMLGENIYYRSATDSVSLYAAQAHDAFMHSPGHRANILTPQYDQGGIGIYRNPATGEYWVTEEFLTVADPK